MSTEDLEEPLTPSHLIIGRRLLSLPGVTPMKPEDPGYLVQSSQADLSRTMQHLNNILKHLWTRWRREYLTGLRESRSRHIDHSDSNELAVGDFVIVNDPGHPRTFWKLAKVSGLLRSSDGQVRGARIQVGSTRSTLR